jgi:hypothetical protein
MLRKIAVAALLALTSVTPASRKAPGPTALSNSSFTSPLAAVSI